MAVDVEVVRLLAHGALDECRDVLLRDADVGFPTLREVGVTEDDLPALVASATGEQSYNLDVDCHTWTPAEVEQAFRAALALERR